MKIRLRQGLLNHAPRPITDEREERLLGWQRENQRAARESVEEKGNLDRDDQGQDELGAAAQLVGSKAERARGIAVCDVAQQDNGQEWQPSLRVSVLPAPDIEWNVREDQQDLEQRRHTIRGGPALAERIALTEVVVLIERLSTLLAHREFEI